MESVGSLTNEDNQQMMATEISWQLTGTTVIAAKSPSTPGVTYSKANIRLVVLLSLVVVAFFLPTLSYEYINLDDNEYVYFNSYVREGFTWAQFIKSFTYIHTVNWHPLTSLSHAIDYELFGLNPGGHHLTNILLHTASSCLFFGLLTSVFAIPRVIATVISLIFALHPMRLESVVWISERKDVLSVFLLLASVLTYCKSVQINQGKISSSYIASIFLYLLACLSKSAVVIGAPLLLLLSWWPLDQIRLNFRRTILMLIPFFSLAFACGLTALTTHHAAGNLTPLSTISLADRLCLALQSCYTYLFKFLWPHPIALFYPQQAISNADLLGYVLLFITLTAAVLFYRQKAPYFLFGWLWYLSSISLISGLIQNGGQAYADRYSYLPHCGVLITLATTWKFISYRKVTGYLASSVAICFLFYIGTVCFQELPHWRSTEAVMKRAATVTENNYLAYVNMSAYLIDEGRLAQAKPYAEMAYALKPTEPYSHYNLALVELGLKNLGRAEQIIRSAKTLSPSPFLNFLEADLLLRQRKISAAAQMAVTNLLSDEPLDDYGKQLLIRLSQTVCRTFKNYSRELRNLRRALYQRTDSFRASSYKTLYRCMVRSDKYSK